MTPELLEQAKDGVRRIRLLESALVYLQDGNIVAMYHDREVCIPDDMRRRHIMDVAEHIASELTKAKKEFESL